MRTLLAVVSIFAMTAVAHAQQGLPPNKTLNDFAGQFIATTEQLDSKSGEWVKSSAKVTGTPRLGGRYVDLDGAYEMVGIERPVTMKFVFSFDPFQKEYRVAAFDDFFGLLDVFEQEQTDPLVFTNLSHGTYLDHDGSRSFTKLTVHKMEKGSFRIDFASSSDDGKTWLEFARLTLKRAKSLRWPREEQR